MAKSKYTANKALKPHNCLFFFAILPNNRNILPEKPNYTGTFVILAQMNLLNKKARFILKGNSTQLFGSRKLMELFYYTCVVI